MQLRAVGKRYRRGPWVLSGVDADLPPGELVAFRGANGSGKSTLLRIVAGASRPSSGRVLGRPGEIGYVPERFPADDRMSARGYLTRMGRIRGLRGKSAGSRTDELLTRLALTRGADRSLSTLSKGNARKVALAQALLVPPRLLVLDEPWSGLDASAQAELAGIMREIADSGGAVVFTDHRESVVRTNADIVYQVTGGRVALDRDAGQEAPAPTRLVLRAPSGLVRSAEWEARDGVLDVQADSDRIVVHVSASHADRIVLSALHDGWSLVTAAPADQGDRSPR